MKRRKNPVGCNRSGRASEHLDVRRCNGAAYCQLRKLNGSFDRGLGTELREGSCMVRKNSTPTAVRRREFLAGAAILLFSATRVGAATISGQLPWTPNAGSPPSRIKLGPWEFFTGEEGRAMEAIADCVIPPDPETPGGREAGCAVFIDRQLAGPYGQQDGLYIRPPFLKGTKSQGSQSEAGPAQKYREALGSFDRACKSKYSGKAFADLSAADQDAVLSGLESGELKLDRADGKAFFEQAIKDIQMGFFADPIYGGNRDMVAWKMIGYPGARYNYLDWVNRHNERFPLPPVSMTGRAEWTSQAR
ncbi:gluconate 2-dehydrogenase subunit 3 family protein [Bradyrhizobium japonicum]|uniref:gluconate 2-dehydrogenase subunit 3 family protein n=1 Tax=Bradyrhizobium japonicum TaxID=375 RepID=UPI0020138ED6|nr:gluconate 2-dehydrogenase subunit 3 family protein [Bradyrhizobium japonicum]